MITDISGVFPTLVCSKRGRQRASCLRGLLDLRSFDIHLGSIFDGTLSPLFTRLRGTDGPDQQHQL